MNVLITESQYKTLLSESNDYIDPTIYNPEKLYQRDKIVGALKRGPKYLHTHIKTLPRVPIKNSNGETIIATKISHTIFNYLFGNF